MQDVKIGWPGYTKMYVKDAADLWIKVLWTDVCQSGKMCVSLARA